VPIPNLQSLAESGLILDNYYVQPVCSPTRSSILTGRHVIHTSELSFALSFGEHVPAFSVGIFQVLCVRSRDWRICPLALASFFQASTTQIAAREIPSRCRST
jgi:hypothetical protein